MKGNSGVRRYRVMLGYSQKDMADVFKISTQAYSKKERGLTRFTSEEMKTIKTLVNRDVDPSATIDSIFFASE